MEKIKFKYTEDIAVNSGAVAAEEGYFDGYKEDYYNTLSVWLRMAQTMSGVYKFCESLCDNGKEIMLSYALDGVVITKRLFMYFEYDYTLPC